MLPIHIYIVYAHPSKSSFTYEVLQSFLSGLKESGHTFQVGDLYELNFKSEMDANEYEREMSWVPTIPISDDVKLEQAKIQPSDALVFVYPVWWSDCPAKLKGWFDRVWSNGFAYFYDDGSRRSFINPKKALVLCTAGHTVEHLEEIGIAESMRCIMLKDRLCNVGFQEVRMEILGGMTEPTKNTKQMNLDKAYQLGLAFFSA